MYLVLHVWQTLLPSGSSFPALKLVTVPQLSHHILIAIRSSYSGYFLVLAYDYSDALEPFRTAGMLAIGQAVSTLTGTNEALGVACRPSSSFE